MERKILSLSFVLLMLLSGCATVMTGKYQNIPVDSEPPGAKVTTSTGATITTPGSFDLIRNEKYILLAEYPGRKPQQVQIKHKAQGWFYGNILLGGIIGMIVDLNNGASDELVPEKVHFSFAPPAPIFPETSQVIYRDAHMQKLKGRQTYHVYDDN